MTGKERQAKSKNYPKLEEKEINHSALIAYLGMLFLLRLKKTSKSSGIKLSAMGSIKNGHNGEN